MEGSDIKKPTTKQTKKTQPTIQEVSFNWSRRQTKSVYHGHTWGEEKPLALISPLPPKKNKNKIKITTSFCSWAHHNGNTGGDRRCPIMPILSVTVSHLMFFGRTVRNGVQTEGSFSWNSFILAGSTSNSNEFQTWLCADCRSIAFCLL